MDAEDLRDIFRSLGPVHVRRMFGGQGIYQGELMFALVASGEVYLKADDETAGFFRDRGSRPFAYETRDGRRSIMGYWLMPESALDDPDEAAELATMAVAAARRAKSAQVRKGSRTRKARKAAEETAT
ncbi:TfoX/Sxy family protein [Microvirga lotononidis]|uniref:Regulator of competence-specific genes n=1 Tax=Microvirga lotononidis TaxID=864069 RepID=I4YZU7_9HYPH|nr:TfoX/Sxy family protein [Microvirga lotononidis]EIM29489.1 regulator of competence-specific genes [Microvirga lotononidis]WQO27196.1 TfoX/Sxy family protein [Microvirga lotononidis]